MLLQSGQFTEGWAEHEWRFQAHITHLRTYLQPVWRGEPMAGKTLLVWAEQGYGDTIQFVRFIPQLAARGIAVVLQVQPPLVSLLSGMTGAARVIGLDEDPPPFDRHIALMSLPHLLGVTLDLIPQDCPYLPRPAPLSVPSTPKRRIGVVWAGSPTHHNDRRRSIAVADMAKLTQWSGVDWISLAKDPSALPANVQPPPLALDDFRQTAQVIGSLDLVISVDTAMAHLSGALDVPTWVLLGYAPDWRWLTGRGDSPWYPQVRLFRQTRLGDWAGVLADVIAALNERVGNPRPS